MHRIVGTLHVGSFCAMMILLTGPPACTSRTRTDASAASTSAARSNANPEPESVMTQQNLTPQEAKRILDASQAEYLDVRTVGEYEAGHPAGAWNVPLLELDASGRRSQNPAFLRVVEARFAKDAPLVVGCQSGGRSSMAAQMLRQAGYTRVYNMMGGYGGGRSPSGEDVPGWSELDYPTETASTGDRSYERLRQKSGQ